MTQTEEEKAAQYRPPTPSDEGPDTAAMLDLPGAEEGDEDFERAEDESLMLTGTVPAEQADERLDKVLALLFPGYSRTQLAIWCDLKRVRVNGKTLSRSAKAPAGAAVVLRPLPHPSEYAYQPEPIPLEVVYSDEFLAVINKQVNLVMHPAAGNWSGTMLNALLHRFPQVTGLPRAGIIHRLDKDTSGLMATALTAAAQLEMARLLFARKIKREYVALAWGNLPRAVTVETFIARDPRERLRMAVCDESRAGAKRAVTHFEPLQSVALPVPSAGGAGRAGAQAAPLVLTAIRCRLETGRTHQIRVHLQHLGLHMAQDTVYGRYDEANTLLRRQALHAWRLSFSHPFRDELMDLRCAVPADMAQFWQQLGGEPLERWNRGD